MALLDLNDRQVQRAEHIQHAPTVADAIPSRLVHVSFVHFHEVLLLDVDYQQSAVFIKFHNKTSVIQL